MGEALSGDESWVDDFALQFDQAWRSGTQPRIEDYLVSVAEPRRGLLLEELVRVELQRRRGRGEDPSPAEYHRRFPDDAPVIDAALGLPPADSPGVEAAPRDAPQPAAEGPGSRIGPYKLLQKIGEGGMGIVYMAERMTPFRRMVALKVIKPGMDSRQVVARFEAERQALALMDHPHIAKVLDAGATESGRPYFVMELVKGIPITRYCDERTAHDPRAAGAVHPGLPGGAARASEGDHPPRHQAVERAGGPLRREARAQGHRLRRRQGDRAEAHRVRRCSPGSARWSGHRST